MHDEQVEKPAGDVRLTQWDGDDHATIEAGGEDVRTTLAAVLRAVLTLAVPKPAPPADPAATRAAPIRGEGSDLAALTADLVDDLLAQIEDTGAGSLAVTLDGLVRRDDGGFVVWGYLETTAQGAPRVIPVQRLGMPEVEDDAAQVRARLSLVRPPGT